MNSVPTEYKATGLDLLLLAIPIIENDAADSGLCSSGPHWLGQSSDAASMEMPTSENTSGFATSSGVTDRPCTAPTLLHQSLSHSGFSMGCQNSSCNDGLLNAFVEEDSETGDLRSLSDTSSITDSVSRYRASLHHSHTREIGTPEFFLSHQSCPDGWISGLPAFAFSVNLSRKLAGQLSPDEFMLTLLALLSTYRILNQMQPFTPTQRSESYLTGLEELGRGGNIEDAGSLLERIAHSAIKIGRSLGLPLLSISYLWPHQLEGQ
ncbi:hypothetical protein PG994_010006 [Apiospora phragmitis]|uniref:Uncharacterized protein n=1 Tax=Apiospora phragmitis TaxID=2905665 RepID=A0ABR1TQX4_9PEZI